MVKISISFKEKDLELEVYNHIKKQLNQSAYIKDLVIKDMEKGIKVNILNDIYTKSCEYLWWTYTYEDLMKYITLTGLTVDKSILESKSNKDLAKFIKDYVEGNNDVR